MQFSVEIEQAKCQGVIALEIKLSRLQISLSREQLYSHPLRVTDHSAASRHGALRHHETGHKIKISPLETPCQKPETEVYFVSGFPG